jgi:hypothetical protein
MGMSKKEVLSKQDQIIEFSELEDVIDQPFKTYSSGMQARLTFSTAISVSPDILIIDEALAAGDSAFVEKCLGRIDQIARSGATVLLVTHNTNLIPRFGNRAIWIDNGKIKLDGDACYVSKQYEIDSFLRVQKSSDNKNLEKIGDQLIFLDYVQLQGSPYKDDVYIQGCSLGIKLVFVSKIHSDTAEIYVQIARDDGLVVWTCTSYEYMNLDHKISSFPIIFKPGVNEVAIEIPNILFNVGRYVINVGIEPARDTPRIVDYHDWVRYASTFGVTKESNITVNKAFDSPIKFTSKHLSKISNNSDLTGTITLCKYPYPYKSVIALSNDCEFLSADATFKLLKLLSDPNTYNLEITSSMFWYTTNSLCHSSLSYFDGLLNKPSEHASLILDLCRSGWIDTNHSYGDFDFGGFTRDLVFPVIDIIKKENIFLPIYTNHGTDRNIQNIGMAGINSYQMGDNPESSAYHLDLTKELGAQYFWHDSFFSDTFNFDGSPFIQFKVKDQSNLIGFKRFRGLEGLPAPTMESFDQQVTFDLLDSLVEKEAHTVIYQHLGVSKRITSPEKKYVALKKPFLSQSSHHIFRHMSDLQSQNKCLTMATSRYLKYMRMIENVKLSYSNNFIYVSVDYYDSDTSIFDGLSFLVPDHIPVTKIFLTTDSKNTLELRMKTKRHNSHFVCYYRPYISLNRGVFDE